MNNELHKEHVVHDIEKLDIKQQNIENKLQELTIFYITNKDKYDYDYKLAKTFLDNLQNFIEKEIIYDANEEHLIFNYSHHGYKQYIVLYLAYSKTFNDGNNRTSSEQYKHDKMTADYNFKMLYNYGEEILILGMLMNEKKLKCHENLLKLYTKPKPEKPEELYPDINTVIFFIIIVFYVITVVLVVNYNNKHNHNHNYNTNIMHHHMQCARLIDKHNKLKDIMINKL
jgi:hypothetical protein